MKSYETDASVGPDGILKLENLPFEAGEAVHVRIERSSEVTGDTGNRMLGMHQGMVSTSEDFDAPLPDSFWLGKDADNEASA